MFFVLHHEVGPKEASWLCLAYAHPVQLKLRVCISFGAVLHSVSELHLKASISTVVTTSAIYKHAYPLSHFFLSIALSEYPCSTFSLSLLLMGTVLVMRLRRHKYLYGELRTMSHPTLHSTDTASADISHLLSSQLQCHFTCSLALGLYSTYVSFVPALLLQSMH